MYSPYHLRDFDSEFALLPYLIRSKKTIAHIKELLADESAVIADDYGHGIYRCNKCGEFYERFYIRIEFDGGSYEVSYKCPKCKVKLNQLLSDDRNEDDDWEEKSINIDKYPCPKCGKHSLYEGGLMMLWDWGGNVLELKGLIESFFKYVQERDIEIYNEFSLQHELGIYLRNTIANYKVQFERNVSFFSNDNKTIKREIDIAIFNDDKSEKYAIELKHPLNGQHPEQMYSFAKDIKFMEELKDRGFNKTACVVLVCDRSFYEGKMNTGIYNYFRQEYAVYGDIYKPTGANKNSEFISLTSRHEFRWQDLNDRSKFYVIEM